MGLVECRFQSLPAYVASFVLLVPRLFTKFGQPFVAAFWGTEVQLPFLALELATHEAK